MFFVQVASVAYRYRKWNLGNDIVLICRCELDAVQQVPHHTIPYPGLWIRIDLMRIRVQHFSQLRIRIRIQFQIQGFDDQKIEKICSCKTFFYIFWIENFNLLILRPP